MVASTALSSLTTGSGTTTVTAGLATSGSQSYGGNLSLGAATLTTTNSAISVTGNTTLTGAATLAAGIGTVTLGGNRTLGNPTGLLPGMTGRIRIIQDATGSRLLSFASHWIPLFPIPSLVTTPAHYDVIEYDVVSANIVHFSLARDPH